ncbi:hypothetical protein ACRAWF_22255 [Streptomyces sp. L7]
MDVDGHPESLRQLPARSATGEPQLAVREGVLSVPRLATAPLRGRGLLAGGTVLITGGTGSRGDAGPASRRPARCPAARPRQPAR